MKLALNRFIALGAVVFFTLVLVARAQLPSRPERFVVHTGLPDLVVHASATPTQIIGGAGLGGAHDSSVVTVAVENRFTLNPYKGKAVWVSGAEVPLFIAIYVPAPLTQVGNVIVPSGFQWTVSDDFHTVFCYGGTIPAGGSINIVVEVVAANNWGCVGEWANVRAVADPSSTIYPFGLIAEVSETNNEASVTISGALNC